MIVFEHNDGELRKAVFGGTIGDLCADLCLEISLIYGAMKRKDKGLADEFERNLSMLFVDRGLRDAVFNTELYDAISNSKEYASGGIVIGDEKEFKRQLRELLDEDE